MQFGPVGMTIKVLDGVQAHAQERQHLTGIVTLGGLPKGVPGIGGEPVPIVGYRWERRQIVGVQLRAGRRDIAGRDQIVRVIVHQSVLGLRGPDRHVVHAELSQNLMGQVSVMSGTEGENRARREQRETEPDDSAT